MRALGLRGVAIVSAMLGGVRCDPSIPRQPAPPPAARDAGADAPVVAPDAHEAGVDTGDAGRLPPPADAAGEAPDAARTDTPPQEGGAAAEDGARDEAPAALLPGPGDVVIDEILVDPAGNDLGREWIEIANTTSWALDLTGVHVSDGTTDVAVDGGVLQAGALLVLGQSLDATKNGGAPVQVAYATRLQLNNGGDMVAICRGACATGVVLDAFAWDASLGSAYVGHAIIIERPGGDICPATEPFGTGGSFGSPGQPNPPCPAPDAGTEAGSGPLEAGAPDSGAADAETAEVVP